MCPDGGDLGGICGGGGARARVVTICSEAISQQSNEIRGIKSLRLRGRSPQSFSCSRADSLSSQTQTFHTNHFSTAVYIRQNSPQRTDRLRVPPPQTGSRATGQNSGRRSRRHSSRRADIGRRSQERVPSRRFCYSRESTPKSGCVFSSLPDCTTMLFRVELGMSSLGHLIEYGTESRPTPTKAGSFGIVIFALNYRS
jgi:hypothetical protein